MVPILPQKLIAEIEDYGSAAGASFAWVRWVQVGKSWLAVMRHKTMGYEIKVDANSQTRQAFSNKLDSARRSHLVRARPLAAL